MVCILRGEPSATPKLWVGVILVDDERCGLPLAGRTILEHVIERARPQVSTLVLCTARDPSPLARHGLPVVAPGFPGLLAAILAGFDWTAAHSRETAWVATFTADVPVFPGDLVERLGHAVGARGADMAWAEPGERSVPVFGLWPVRLRRALGRALAKDPGLGVEEWAALYRPARVRFSPGTEPFMAVHEPQDLTLVERYLTSRARGSVVR